MTVLTLNAANKKDRAIWHETFERLPPVCRDIHFDPEYMQVYADTEGSKAQCLINEFGEPFPFIRRDNELGNAYGYGFAVPMKSIVFSEWLKQEGIERIRYRLHPFLPYSDKENLIYRPYSNQEKLIVYMDLSLDPRAELRKGHASSIVLANKSGVAVDESHDIELFYAMYCAMLERNEADPKWKFSLNLLIKLREAYPDGFRIFIASVDGQPEAGGTAYYHYAGSFGRWRSIGVNNLLVIKAAEYAKSIGCKRLHLGGGLTADSSDTLLRFKTGFSKHRCWVYKYQWQAKAQAA